MAPSTYGMRNSRRHLSNQFWICFLDIFAHIIHCGTMKNSKSPPPFQWHDCQGYITFSKYRSKTANWVSLSDTTSPFTLHQRLSRFGNTNEEMQNFGQIRHAQDQQIQKLEVFQLKQLLWIGSECPFYSMNHRKCGCCLKYVIFVYRCWLFEHFQWNFILLNLIGPYWFWVHVGWGKGLSSGAPFTNID